MQLDRILIGIFREIQKEVKDEFGEDYEIDELKKIVVSQFKSTANGIKNKMTVKLDYWGKFLIKPGREVAINTSKKLKGRPIEERKRILNGTVFRELN